MRCAAAVLAMMGLALNSLGGPQSTREKGLVAHWDFREGRGETLHDRSGNGNHGAIRNQARWVKNGEGWALQFDGIDDHVDCGQGATLDMTDQVSYSLWIYPQPAVRSGEAGILGKPFDWYGLTAYDGINAYISGGPNRVTARPKLDAWSHVVSTYDGKSLCIYVNGKLAQARPLAVKMKAGGRFWIGRSDGLPVYTRDAHFRGQITDVRVYGRALSAEQVAELYATTNITGTIGLTATAPPFQRAIIVEVATRGLGPRREGAAVALTVRRNDTDRPLASDTIREFDESGGGMTVLQMADAQPGEYAVEAVPLGADGAKLSPAVVAVVSWPVVEWFPNGPPGGRRLNNLVTELLSVAGPDGSGDNHGFANPRQGWIFISNAGSAQVTLTSDAGGPAQLRLQNDYRGAHETMRELPAGKYAIRADKVSNLVVRAVPEIIFAQYNSEPRIRAFGPFAGSFQKQHVLKHVNTLMCGGIQDDPFAGEWVRQGGKLMARYPVLRTKPDNPSSSGPVTVDDVFQYYVATHNAFQGVMVDEFVDADPMNSIYAQAIRRLMASPQYGRRVFYPFYTGLPRGEGGVEMVNTLIETGNRLAFERYQKEQPSEAEAWRYLDGELVQRAKQLRDMASVSLPRLAVVFGYFSCPPETLDTFPHVNYRAYLDMQFQLAACHPAFKDLGAVMTYSSGYADEEILRFGGQLFRHYAIEGKTDRLCGDPLILTHLRNPDFGDQGRGWTLSPAEEGGIRFANSPGFGTLQGRYPNPVEGDTVIVTRRCPGKPNVFSQRITGLQPGRLYSMEMCTGDFNDMSARRAYTVTVSLDNVAMIREKCFDEVFASIHAFGKYDEGHPAWMNYTWRVFRASDDTAQLTVSDWAAPGGPGGPIGQEMMHNFIQVQPYFEE